MRNSQFILAHRCCFPLVLKDVPGGWTAAITVKQILMGIQDLLDTPNNGDAAQDKAYKVYKSSKAEYGRLVREQAKRLAPVN